MRFNVITALMLGLLAAGCGREERPSMVLITIDTLRADVLACYGYGKDLSPNLSRLAREGVRFANVTAASPWTAPSVASITTGMYPDEVGVRDLKHGLPRSVTTLAERLKRAGYATGAVVSNTLAGPEYGHDQGYDFMHCLRYKDDEGAPSFTADRVTDQALEWMRSAKAPFFLCVHYTDPHDPYLPPDEFLDERSALDRARLLESDFDASMKEAVKACYEAEVAFMDREVGRLLDALNRDILVVFTGDHGEEFQEHGGYLHGHTLFQELLSVPLLFRGPGVPQGAAVHAPVSHVDITPTLLDYAGIPEKLSGESLRPFFRNTVLKPRPRLLFSVLENEDSRRVAARQGPWKIEVRTDRAPARHFAALYHLEEDPGEERNVATENPELVSNLIESMRARRSRLMEPEGGMDDETRLRREEELRALGYIK